MRSKELKELNQRFYDQVFGDHNIDAIDDLLTDDFVEHTPAPGDATDRAGVKATISELFVAFPDLTCTIESQVAEGDTVAAVARMTGTHRGEFQGMPATGRKFSVQFLESSKVRDGRFCDHWGLVDVPTLMSQLGVPTPA